MLSCVWNIDKIHILFLQLWNHWSTFYSLNTVFASHVCESFFTCLWLLCFSQNVISGIFMDVFYEEQCTHTHTHTHRQTDRQTDRHTHTQTDRQTDRQTHTHSHSRSSLWHSTEAVAFFTPRPRPYFPSLPALLSRLVILERLSLHCSPKLEKIMDLINWSLNAIDTIFWVRGNLTALTERSQLATRWTRGRDGESCVWRLFPWRTLKISTYSEPW